MKKLSLHFLLQIAAVLSLLLGSIGCQVRNETEPTVVVKVDPTATPTRESTKTPTPTPLPTNTPIPPAGISDQKDPAISPAGIEINIYSKEELDLAKTLGVSWIRVNAFLWSEVEPEEGQRYWAAVSGLDEALKQASERGLHVILIVRSTPGWAQKKPGYFCGFVQEDKLPAYARFMADLVARYSQPPFNIHDYELGNEPDVDPSLVPPDSVFGCMGDKTDPYYGGGEYAQMLKAVYPVIKSADPNSKVIIGGLLLYCDPNNPPMGQNCTPAKYVEGILQAGGGPYFDTVSYHGYDTYMGSLGVFDMPLWNTSSDTNGTAGIAKASYLQDLLIQYGFPDKEFINSETGVLCGRTGEEEVCQNQVYTDTKANYVVRGYVSNLANNIRSYIWFSMRGWRATGLVDQNLQPNSAFHSYQFAIKELSGATFTKKLSLESGLEGYEYKRGNSNVWVLWAIDGAEHQIELRDKPTTIYDLMGNKEQIGPAIAVNNSPVYVEFATH